jgi:hypothetical protein
LELFVISRFLIKLCVKDLSAVLHLLTRPSVKEVPAQTKQSILIAVCSSIYLNNKELLCNLANLLYLWVQLAMVLTHNSVPLAFVLTQSALPQLLMDLVEVMLTVQMAFSAKTDW